MVDEVPQGQKDATPGGKGADESTRSPNPRAAVIAAAKARAAAQAAAKASRAPASAQPPLGAAADPSALTPELQAFAAEVEAAAPGLKPDPTTFGLPAYHVAREDLLDVCRALRAAPRPGCDYLTCVTGVDYPGHIEVVYHLFSIARPAVGVVLKAAAPKSPDAVSDAEEKTEALPWLPSVTGVWPGAEWHEREIFDLLGVRFEGHPDLRRILMPEGFSGGYPLRKDYVDRREQRTRKVRVR